MTSNLIEQRPLANEAEAATGSRLPGCKSGVDSLRAEISGKSSMPAQRLNPEELKKLYLTGKLSMNQLAYELRSYNSNTADWIMREAKRSSAQVMDYRGAPDAKAANSTISSNDGEYAGTPRNAAEAGKQARDTDDPEKKRQAEKSEVRFKKLDALDLVTRVNIFNEQQQQEQKASQLMNDAKRKAEREDLEEGLNEEREHGSESDLKSRTRQALRERVRRAIGKERQEGIEKAVSGAQKSSR